MEDADAQDDRVTTDETVATADLEATDEYEAADDTKADDASEKTADGTVASGRSARLRTAAVALLLVAAAVFASVSAWRHHQLDNRAQLRADYIATAREGVERLTTIGAKSADKDVKALLAISSGEFKTQFNSRLASYTKVVQDAAVASKGTIVSIGVERMDDDSATLLVASHAEVTNEATAEPESRDYRFRVVVTNGKPQTISKVDFVL